MFSIVLQCINQDAVCKTFLCEFECTLKVVILLDRINLLPSLNFLEVATLNQKNY